MPIPFILAGVAVATGVTGLYKSATAIGKNSEANKLAEDINTRLKESTKNIDVKRKQTNYSLGKLGEGKVKLVESLDFYISQLRKIRNIDYKEIHLSNSQLANETALREIEIYTIKLTNLIGGFAVSGGSGALAAFGAYSGAMLWGTASTGAPIAGLAGVAANNATLAFLGGGSLAAGGYGMAGGAMVLGGLVAGPFLAAGGFVFDYLAEKKLNDTKAEIAKAESAHQQQLLFIKALDNIKFVTEQFNKLLNDVRTVQDKTNNEVTKIIDKKTDWLTFSSSEKEKIHNSFLVAQLSKGLLEISILDENGGLIAETIDKIKNLEQLTTELKEKN
ncbi:hypothetical protein [Exiguobacterium indicum]|uniref:hypothetical protein n=1 Tax=Exiguobacterium indicum TaxID=296995 RepID=UPI002B261BA6|nr:hypothetical protein [Exiguobacterium indicum]